MSSLRRRIEVGGYAGRRTAARTGRVAYLFDRASFPQTLDPEAVSNGDFSNWSGVYPNRDPDLWAVSGEVLSTTEVSEVGSGATHGGGGTGAINFFGNVNNQPRISQTCLTAGRLYESLIDVSARASGNLAFTSGLSPLSNNYAVVNLRRGLSRAAGTLLQFGAGTQPNDLTLNSMSVKPINPNPYVELSAEQGTYEFWFGLSPVPMAGDQVSMLFHVQDSDDAYFDCWEALIRRDATNTSYDFRLERYVAGVRNNHINILGVGNVDGVKIANPAGLFTAYTRLNGAYTQQGAQVSNSTHQSETGFQQIYTTGIVPIRVFATSQLV